MLVKRDEKVVLLYDMDRTDWRNRNLMLAANYYESRGYRALLNEDPALYPPGTPIHASLVFIRNRYKVFRLLDKLGVKVTEQDPLWVDMELPEHIKIGGTGWNILKKAPPEFEDYLPKYSLYDRFLPPADYAQGFLTRGCPRGCDFCVVPRMSGDKAESVTTFQDLLDGNPSARYVRLMDDNFLAGPKDFVREQLRWAIDNKIRFSLTQGADIRFMNEEWAELLAASRFTDVKGQGRIITFAFDSPKIDKQYRRGFEYLMRAGIKPWQVQSFVLVGFESTVEEDMLRIAILRELGALPYVMVYEPIHGEGVPAFYVANPHVLDRYGEHLTLEEKYYRHWKRCKDLQRYANFRAIWKSVLDFELYEPWIRRQRQWAEEDRLGIRRNELPQAKHRNGWGEDVA